MRVILFIAVLFGLTAVVAGAVGDHALHMLHTSRQYQAYLTAVRYQMWHAIVLLIIGFAAYIKPELLTRKLIRFAVLSFILAIILFSGTIYFVTFSHFKILLYLVPFGGTLFMLGWLSLLGCVVIL